LINYYYKYKKLLTKENLNYYMPQRIFVMYYRHLLKSIRYLDNKEISIAKHLREFDYNFKNSAPELYFFIAI